MPSMHHEQIEVTGGVDTHADTHVAAVVDQAGRILGTASFPATPQGYRALHRWLEQHGELKVVGVEGTGSYGVGLTRFLTRKGVPVLEVNRPNRQTRRRRGKSDTVDAEAAARSALNGEASAIPKGGDGPVEAIRALRLARRSAIKARAQAANQIGDLVINAPEQLRLRLDPLNTMQRVDACARFRPGPVTDPTEATKTALRSLARRHIDLTAEIDRLDSDLLMLCAKANVALLGVQGVGPEVAATLLVTAGDNPHRLRSEAAFAALCGASPIEASSGKTTRHRLNHGGDRLANNALWRIVMVRLLHCDRTRAYAAQRRSEGKSTKEIIRCLKRYVAREIYRYLTNPPPVIDATELRPERIEAGHTLATVATAIHSTPMGISRLERGLQHDNDLAHRYSEWLDRQRAA